MRHTIIPALLLTAATACSAPPGLGTDQPDTDVTEVSATTAGLDPQTILSLMEEYPRLGEEPLPEPQPSSDARMVSASGGPDVSIETTSGEATFYAQKFEGRRTASGIPFRQNQMVAAHRAYPFGTILRVTNTRNDRSVNVRVVDRGPFGNSARAKRTVLDLSRRAATELDYIQAGRAPVKVEVLEWGRGINAT